MSLLLLLVVLRFLLLHDDTEVEERGGVVKCRERAGQASSRAVFSSSITPPTPLSGVLSSRSDNMVEIEPRLLGVGGLKVSKQGKK
jgi:hypothetical protein